jgi:predicted flap endonuclease-1-like 5' DNA nuclease
VIKKLFQFAGFVGLVAAIVWLTREHLLPTPHVPHEPPPHYRSTPPPPEATPDDLTQIKGIGPVYAGRLEMLGITTFRALSESDERVIADSLGTTDRAAADWISQARARIA